MQVFFASLTKFYTVKHDPYQINVKRIPKGESKINKPENWAT